MKRIRHGVGTFLSDDELADLMLSYAAVLTKVRQVDVVEVPAMDDEGKRFVVSLLVGWQLPLSAATVSDAMIPDGDGSALRRTAADLRSRIAHRTIGGPARPLDAMAPPPDDFD